MKGGLRLDARDAILKGGETGPAAVAGQPDESLLIEAVNYGDALQMPPKSRLAPDEVATLTRWVALGLPWPAEVVKATGPKSGFDLEARKAVALGLAGDRAGTRSGRQADGLAARSDRPVPAREPGGQGADARSRGREAGVDPSSELRPDGSAASFPRRLPRSNATRHRTPTSGWSIGCSRRPGSASAGGGTGWTSSATPRPGATSSTRRSRTRGSIAITSSGP